MEPVVNRSKFAWVLPIAVLFRSMAGMVALRSKIAAAVPGVVVAAPGLNWMVLPSKAVILPPL